MHTPLHNHCLCECERVLCAGPLLYDTHHLPVQFLRELLRSARMFRDLGGPGEGGGDGGVLD